MFSKEFIMKKWVIPKTRTRTPENGRPESGFFEPKTRTRTPKKALLKYGPGLQLNLLKHGPGLNSSKTRIRTRKKFYAKNLFQKI